MAIIDDKKTVHFGAAGMSDYTKHKDKERKERYLARHKNNEQWNNPLTAGFYATNIIRDTNRRFKNINVKLR